MLNKLPLQVKVYFIKMYVRKKGFCQKIQALQFISDTDFCSRVSVVFLSICFHSSIVKFPINQHQNSPNLQPSEYRVQVQHPHTDTLTLACCSLTRTSQPILRTLRKLLYCNGCHTHCSLPLCTLSKCLSHTQKNSVT